MEHVSRWRNGLAIACRHARSAPTFGEQVADKTAANRAYGLAKGLLGGVCFCREKAPLTPS
jgi:hypothetical protein